MPSPKPETVQKRTEVSCDRPLHSQPVRKGDGSHITDDTGGGLLLIEGDRANAAKVLEALETLEKISTISGQSQVHVEWADDFLPSDHLDSYSLTRAVRSMLERSTKDDALFVEKGRAEVTLNSIGDGVLSTDLSGKVTYLNTVAERMTGWSRSAANGRPLAEIFNIIDAATRKPPEDPMALAVRRGKTVSLSTDCILIRRDGHEVPIEDSAAPIYDRGGRITGAVIVFHDVSEAKQMAT